MKTPKHSHEWKLSTVKDMVPGWTCGKEWTCECGETRRSVIFVGGSPEDFAKACEVTEYDGE